MKLPAHRHTHFTIKNWNGYGSVGWVFYCNRFKNVSPNWMRKREEDSNTMKLEAIFFYLILSSLKLPTYILARWHIFFHTDLFFELRMPPFNLEKLANSSLNAAVHKSVKLCIWYPFPGDFFPSLDQPDYYLKWEENLLRRLRDGWYESGWNWGRQFQWH